jgi:hypothetical protein
MSAPTQAPQDWRALPAGDALDRLVAARVFGWVCTGAAADVWTSPDGLSHFGVSPYSTSINAAWQVVERLETQGLRITYRTSGLNARRVEVVGVHPTRRNEWLVAEEADTAPLAICRAALTAVEAA